MIHDSRDKREKHALNSEGMVMCNARDREAAHRAEMEGIATDDLSKVTCPKCRPLVFAYLREARRNASIEPGAGRDDGATSAESGD